MTAEKVYNVAIEETYITLVEVSATSEEDAERRVGCGQGEILSTVWKSRSPATAKAQET